MIDHFQTFSLPRRFGLDLAALEQSYRELSRTLHPDKFASAAPGERRAALERSTALNDAYKVLKDPRKRAAHLFELAGLALDREDPAGRQPVSMSPEFLETFLDLREASEGANAAEKAELRQHLAAESERRLTSLSGDLAELAEAYFATPLPDPPPASPREGGSNRLRSLAQRLLELRYYDRFLAELEEEAEQDDG